MRATRILLEPAMRATQTVLSPACLVPRGELAALRLVGACGTSPLAPVDRLRRSRSTSLKEHTEPGPIILRAQPADRLGTHSGAAQ